VGCRFQLPQLAGCSSVATRAGGTPQFVSRAAYDEHAVQAESVGVREERELGGRQECGGLERRLLRRACAGDRASLRTNGWSSVWETRRQSDAMDRFGGEKGLSVVECSASLLEWRRAPGSSDSSWHSRQNFYAGVCPPSWHTRGVDNGDGEGISRWSERGAAMQAVDETKHRAFVVCPSRYAALGTRACTPSELPVARRRLWPHTSATSGCT
jgi:hypothetical protein